MSTVASLSPEMMLRGHAETAWSWRPSVRPCWTAPGHSGLPSSRRVPCFALCLRGIHSPGEALGTHRRPLWAVPPAEGRPDPGVLSALFKWSRRPPSNCSDTLHRLSLYRGSCSFSSLLIPGTTPQMNAFPQSYPRLCRGRTLPSANVSVDVYGLALTLSGV